MSIKKVAVIVIAATFFSLVPAFSSSVQAATFKVDTGCTKLPSYTSTITFKSESYDAYVRLGKRGDIAHATAYSQGQDGACHKIGSRQVNGDEWTKIGSLTTSNQEYVLELAAKELTGVPSANRPTIMLVPKHNPACRPTDECRVSIKGQTGIVRPVGTLLEQDLLHVLFVTNPASDQLQHVKYYVDNELVYTTKTLQPFDMRYVTYPGQELKRVAVYQSGQQILLQATSPTTHADTFGNFIFRLSHKYPTLLAIAIVILLFFLAINILRYAVRKRQEWHEHTNYAHQSANPLLVRLRTIGLHHENLLRILRTVSVVTIVAAGGAVVALSLNGYVLTIMTVSGTSMQKTYKTGDIALVNRLPKTIATLNGKEYIPKRGDVVVVQGIFGNSPIPDDKIDSVYLIKRVIGLPGERVTVKNGKVTVYDPKTKTSINPDANARWSSTYTPNLPTESVSIQLSDSELFISGDNRPDSVDSRFNGPIDTKQVIGVVIGNR